MAFTINDADNILRTYYLDAVVEQLDKRISPFYSKIKKSTEQVYGKNARVIFSNFLSGGVSAGLETGDLPKSSSTKYTEISVPLKNLYGTIEISDKAIRAAQSDPNAVINLLNAEMENLINASAYNFGRMLMGDGTGKLGEGKVMYDEWIVFDHPAQYFFEGMLVDFYDYDGNPVEGHQGLKVAVVDVLNNRVSFEGFTMTNEKFSQGAVAYVQGSKDNEIIGLGALFDESKTTLYGLDKASHPWLNAHVRGIGSNITALKIQQIIDAIYAQSRKEVDLIITTPGVLRSIMESASLNRQFNSVNLELGYNALTYNGIPIVADPFCERNRMYFLNTGSFVFHQLCDWQWMEGEDGRILKQIPGKPMYTATLVKYGELICTCPAAQAMVHNVFEDEY